MQKHFHLYAKILYQQHKSTPLKETLCSGIADGYRNKEDAMSACADRSFCKGVIYRYHNNAHGMYYLCRESRLVRTGNHEIAYSKTGQLSGQVVGLLGSRI